MDKMPSEAQQNVTTKLAHVHEQSEFTYGGYFVAAGHLTQTAARFLNRTETRRARSG